MRKWKANSYVLSVCVLISEYVRQQQQDAKRKNSQDFEQISWQLVSILTQIESPDSVCNVVEQISECVTLLSAQEEGEEVDVDSASSTLARTSLLGVFVRSFLLAVNRLLFDGLSRLFDDVQQYLEHFKENVEKEKNMETEREKDSSLDFMGSPASQNVWNEGKVDNDELLLSPIQSSSATPLQNVQQSSLLTPAPMKLDSQDDPAMWSNDQLNYILSDMARGMERGQRDRQHTSQAEGQSTEVQLRQLREKMDGSNPTVLFVRYLSFLHDRDYQGALDSLHQYHDVLSPSQNSRSDVNGSGDGTNSTSISSVWKLSGKVTISAAVAWKMFGHRSLEQVFARVHLSCYEDSASTGEIALTYSEVNLLVLSST
eukprot:jgi/Phyca11/16615/fgenesh1_pg.PHYCAscaffold_21_\